MDARIQANWRCKYKKAQGAGRGVINKRVENNEKTDPGEIFGAHWQILARTDGYWRVVIDTGAYQQIPARPSR